MSDARTGVPRPVSEGCDADREGSATIRPSAPAVNGLAEGRVSRAACQALNDALQWRQDSGRPVRLWLRDDDAVQPGEALDRLLNMTQAQGIPLTLAVIPAFSGAALAQRLQPLPTVEVAVHGWAHMNHAAATEKKQELGRQRPLEQTCAELQRGLQHLQQWHGAQCLPLLVPPWNRIAASLIPRLSSIGFRAVSTFADIRFESMPMLNTHVDIIDWKGSRAKPQEERDGRRVAADEAAARTQARSTRDADELFAELTARLLAGCDITGLLTHHLVHEPPAWHFLEQLFELTSRHPIVQWTAASHLLSAEFPDPGFPGQQQATVPGL
ncbi:polysaccharide deacetylase family protein [Granulosicoccus sp. 3-233]|uniref:polysaccharide deacetylase family protein n=1 Tax=Granulosicoccus sp. 3-233 TaxID=3417969 RepID=UPI003D33D884